MILDNKVYSKNKIVSDRNFTLFFLFIFFLLVTFFIYKSNIIGISFFGFLFVFISLIYFFNKKLLNNIKSKWMVLGTFLSKTLGILIIGLIFVSIICPTGIYYRLFKNRHKNASNFKNDNSEYDFYKEY